MKKAWKNAHMFAQITKILPFHQVVKIKAVVMSVLVSNTLNNKEGRFDPADKIY